MADVDHTHTLLHMERWNRPEGWRKEDGWMRKTKGMDG